MVIPGNNVRQQPDKNSVHTNSPEETREPCHQFIHYPRELQSSSKISKGITKACYVLSDLYRYINPTIVNTKFIIQG